MFWQNFDFPSYSCTTSPCFMSCTITLLLPLLLVGVGSATLLRWTTNPDSQSELEWLSPSSHTILKSDPNTGLYSQWLIKSLHNVCIDVKEPIPTLLYLISEENFNGISAEDWKLLNEGRRQVNIEIRPIRELLRENQEVQFHNQSTWLFLSTLSR